VEWRSSEDSPWVVATTVPLELVVVPPKETDAVIESKEGARINPGIVRTVDED